MRIASSSTPAMLRINSHVPAMEKLSGERLAYRLAHRRQLCQRHEMIMHQRYPFFVGTVLHAWHAALYVHGGVHRFAPAGRRR